MDTAINIALMMRSVCALYTSRNSFSMMVDTVLSFRRKTLTQSIIIAIDAMGAKKGSRIILEAMGRAAVHRDVQFLVFADKHEVTCPDYLQHAAKFRHAEQIPHDLDRAAILRLRNTSMRLALEAVRSGEAVAAISTGETGVFIGLARMILRRKSGIQKPGLATMWPTLARDCVMIDLGANVESDGEVSGEILRQYAYLGDSFARTLLKIERPRVGLLSMEEELMPEGFPHPRGAAYALINDSDLNFCGYIDGADILKGNIDVIVSDGFTGNIALKTIEGWAKLAGEELKKSSRGSLIAKLGFLLARRQLQLLRQRLNPELYDGAAVLGLTGLAVKSHNNTTIYGFENAIRITKILANNTELFT